MSDLARAIAQACLEEIQRRPDTPTVDELAEVVRPMVPEMGLDLGQGPDETAEVERVYDGTGWVYRRVPTRYQWAERLPWDKLRDPITDGPEHPNQLPEPIRQAYERVRDTHLSPPIPMSSVCPHGDCGGDLMFRCWDGTWKCVSCGGPADPGRGTKAE